MHKDCPNEQFLEFLLADIAAEAAWELSLRLEVIAFGLGVIASAWELSPSAWELSLRLGVIASLGSYRFAWKLCGFAAKLKGQ